MFLAFVFFCFSVLRFKVNCYQRLKSKFLYYLSKILKVQKIFFWKLLSEFLTFPQSLKLVVFLGFFSVTCSSHSETTVGDWLGLHCLFWLPLLCAGRPHGSRVSALKWFIQNRHGPPPCSLPPTLSLLQIVIQTVKPPLMCRLTSGRHTVNFI